MESELELNLQDLESLFFGSDSAAQRGFNQLVLAAKGSDARVASVLSSPSGDFEPADWQFRDGVDLFLAYCSILEIACRIGYTSRDVVRQRYFLHTQPNFDEVLRTRALRYYYQEVFERPLVLQFSLQFSTWTSPEGPREELFPLFQRFLAIELSLGDSSGVKAFVRFLDSVGADGLKAIVNRDLRAPEEFFAVLTSPQDQLTDLGLAIVGLHDLLAFCLTFDNLLRDCYSFAEFRASLLAFYSPYFVRSRRGCSEVLETAVCQFLGWPRPNTDYDQASITDRALRILRSISNVTSAALAPPRAEAPMVSGAG
jgi:hypothetical protein